MSGVEMYRARYLIYITFSEISSTNMVIFLFEKCAHLKNNAVIGPEIKVFILWAIRYFMKLLKCGIIQRCYYNVFFYLNKLIPTEVNTLPQK